MEFLSKNLNVHAFFYVLTLGTFAVLFAFVWILKKYTFFMKRKITQGPVTPTVPYGNFEDVLKAETSLHLFLWKHHNRFKRKGCAIGGLYLFTEPVIVLVDDLPAAIDGSSEIGSLSKKLTNNKIALGRFVDKYNYCVNASLPDKLLKTDDASSVLRDVLLESVCAAFGLDSFEILAEINELLSVKYAATMKFYMALCWPRLFGSKTRTKLDAQLTELLAEVMGNRKKNDVQEDDLLQAFMDFYNSESKQLEFEAVSKEIFDAFADMLTYSHSTLLFCFYELSNSREVQDEVAGEVRRFIKKHKKATFENVEELTYLSAVIKETLRKYPPVASAVRISDGESAPTLPWLPPNRILLFESILGRQRHPTNYTTPEVFDPDRFLDEERVKKNVFLPFGRCSNSDLIMDLVSLQVTLVLVSVYSQLEVKIAEGATGVLKFKPHLLYLCPSDELNLRFERA